MGNETILILLADDTPMWREKFVDQAVPLIEKEFGRAVEVRIAASGDRALEMFEVMLEEGEKITLIVSDHDMPIMTGSELAVEIRRIDSQVPFLGFTADVESLAFFREVLDDDNPAVSAYVLKPENLRDLAPLCQRLICRRLAVLAMDKTDGAIRIM